MAGLLPRQVEIRENPFDELSDDQLEGLIRERMAALGDMIGEADAADEPEPIRH